MFSHTHLGYIQSAYDACEEKHRLAISGATIVTELPLKMGSCRKQPMDAHGTMGHEVHREHSVIGQTTRRTIWGFHMTKLKCLTTEMAQMEKTHTMVEV